MVLNPSPDSITPFMAQYSSSSPIAPLTATDPNISSYCDNTNIPPGNGHIFPSVMLTIDWNVQNFFGSFSERNLSLTNLVGILKAIDVYAFA